MSLEEARHTLTARILADAGAHSIRDGFNRLILEVRAEMPCYLWGCEGPQTREPAGHLLWGCARYDLEGMCPSCKAREALKEQTHA